MISAPKNPMHCMLEGLCDLMAKSHEDTNVTLAQTRKPRPLLKPSRLEDEGLCC